MRLDTPDTPQTIRPFFLAFHMHDHSLASSTLAYRAPRDRERMNISSSYDGGGVTIFGAHNELVKMSPRSTITWPFCKQRVAQLVCGGFVAFFFCIVEETTAI